MKIAIDISPLSSAHRVRGVGFYLAHLKEALDKTTKHEFIYFVEKAPDDVDLIHYPYFDPFSRSFSQKNDIPLVVTVHDLTPLVFPKHFPAGLRGNLNWQFNKFFLRSVSQIITDSQCSASDVSKYTGVASKKITSIYLAAGKEFRPGPRHLELAKKYNIPTRFALYVGDVTWNKNLPRVIKAAEKVKLPLVLVGKAITEKDFVKSNPWNKDRIEVQALLKTAKNIHALGFVESEDLVKFYQTAEMLVMPSLYEGFGLPVVEAMQSGCPVVTSKEGSLGEVAGEAAYLVDAYSEDSIAEGIKMVFDSEKIRKELTEKGLKRAKEFSWDKTATQTIAVYEKTISH
ncbi:MAG TPA: glycosyltransferase family 1 protein [Patescibacteria group bacterium]|nr:glycosyltransferase family 1 protein [Patescibacteria group bacterium]